MHVTIPVASTATIYVPAVGPSVVMESGFPAGSVPGLKYLGMVDGAAAYAASSGVYNFSSRDAAAVPARLTGLTPR